VAIHIAFAVSDRRRRTRRGGTSAAGRITIGRMAGAHADLTLHPLALMPYQPLSAQRASTLLALPILTIFSAAPPAARCHLASARITTRNTSSSPSLAYLTTLLLRMVHLFHRLYTLLCLPSCAASHRLLSCFRNAPITNSHTRSRRDINAAHQYGITAAPLLEPSWYCARAWDSRDANIMAAS